MSFIFKITTTTSPQTFVIPCTNTGTFNATVNYGDGTGSQTVTAYNDSNLTHSFATAGQHTITIDGTFPNVRFYDDAASRVLVDEVVDLGDVNWINLYQAFRDCTNLTAFNVGTTDTSSVTTMAAMFRNCSGLTSLDLSSFDTSSVTTMQQMFQNCTNLTSLNLSGFDTSSVNNMSYMFRNCSSLTTLDLSSFDTSSVTTMREMFNNCSSLTVLDVTSFNTSSVTAIQLMFQDCSSLTVLDLSNFNTSNAGTMAAMFRDCSSLTTLDLSSFDTSSVNNMITMLYNCSSLTSLNVSSFDTSSVATMGYMFQGCSSLASLDVSGFDTSSVTDMGLMFYNCSSLTSLDLSSFDTSSVNNMGLMFYNCSSLTNLDIKNFNVSSVANGINFLLNANNALTTTAYDELLEAWAAQDVQPNVPWHFGDAQYTVEAIADWYSPRGNSSLSIINNKLVSIAGSTAVFGAGQQVDNLIVGNVYKMKARSTCNNAAATMFLTASASTVLTPSVIFTQGTSTVLIDSLFTATATTMYFGVVVNGHAANDTVTIDAGITVKEITNYTEANAASEIEYSQENVFGSEEVVNGDFATNLSGWTVYSQTAVWSVDGIVIDGSSGTAQVSQLLSLQANSTYEVSMTNVSKTRARILLGTQWWNNDVYDSSNFTEDLKFYVTPTVSSVWIQLNIPSGVIATLDNVSVKEITNAVEYKNIPQSARELYSLEDDTWTGSNELVVNGDFATNLSGWAAAGGGWSWDNGTAKLNGDGSLQTLTQFNTPVGKTYEATVNVSNLSGNLIAFYGGTPNQSLQNGVNTYRFTSVSNTTQFKRGSGIVTANIDNVSIKEIVEVAS